ncbi:MAG: hypothetical protein H7323_00665 [Frankiales bacterium]|nr:hypothetical protein [Frankiales bacterium]
MTGPALPTRLGAAAVRRRIWDAAPVLSGFDATGLGDGQVRYDPVTRPGPLADPSDAWMGSKADTFRGNHYLGEVLDEELVVHRWFGGPAGEAGPFWAPGLPQGPCPLSSATPSSPSGTT